MSKDNELNIKFGADVSGLQTGSQTAANEFQQAVGVIKGSVGELNMVFAGFTALLAGGGIVNRLGQRGRVDADSAGRESPAILLPA